MRESMQLLELSQGNTVTGLKVEGEQMTEQNQEGLAATVAAAPQAQPEEMLPQSKVNKVVGAAKHESYQKGYNDAVQALQAQQQPAAPVAQAPVQQISDADMHAKIEKALAERMQVMEGQKRLDELKAKVNEAQTRYPDFEE